jgi:hypothetical protein
MGTVLGDYPPWPSRVARQHLGMSRVDEHVVFDTSGCGAGSASAGLAHAAHAAPGGPAPADPAADPAAGRGPARLTNTTAANAAAINAEPQRRPGLEQPIAALAAGASRSRLLQVYAQRLRTELDQHRLRSQLHHCWPCQHQVPQDVQLPGGGAPGLLPRPPIEDGYDTDVSAPAYDATRNAEGQHGYTYASKTFSGGARWSHHCMQTTRALMIG